MMIIHEASVKIGDRPPHGSPSTSVLRRAASWVLCSTLSTPMTAKPLTHYLDKVMHCNCGAGITWTWTCPRPRRWPWTSAGGSRGGTTPSHHLRNLSKEHKERQVPQSPDLWGPGMDHPPLHLSEEGEAAPVEPQIIEEISELCGAAEALLHRSSL